MSEGGIAMLLLFLAFIALGTLEAVHSRNRARTSGDTSGRTITNFGLVVLVLLAGSTPLLSRLSASNLAEVHGVGLTRVVSLGWPLVFALTLLAQSLAAYWVHRMAHAVPLLWRVHRIHHSDELLDISTGLRNHPLELVFAFPASVAIVMLVGPSASVVIAVDTLLFIAALWQHADLTLPASVDRHLGKLFVTPALHRIHHAPERAVHDRNYGDLFMIWDRLFGTYAQASEPGSRVGLDQQRAKPDSLIGQLVAPLHRV